MKYLIVGFVLALTMLLVSCKEPTNEEVFYEMQKTLNGMESYSCTAQITMKGNKSPKAYTAKHIFMNPNKYIIEIQKPDESKGIITVFDGNRARLYHPLIDESVVIDDFINSPDQNMFVGYFLKNFVETEDVSLETEVIDDREYLVLITTIPGNNKYRQTEKLWISKDNFIPYRLIVLDEKQDITIEVLYRDFRYNGDIKEEDFSIEASKELINKI